MSVAIPACKDITYVLDKPRSYADARHKFRASAINQIFLFAQSNGRPP
jgi:hypothetical protein